MKSAAIVVTTIQCETYSLRAFRAAADANGLESIIVADRKTPNDSWQDYEHFLAFELQRNLGFTLESRLPVDHYARKNLGYLFAIRKGSKCLYDTDDDNAPLPTWRPRVGNIWAQRVSRSPWANAYSLGRISASECGSHCPSQSLGPGRRHLDRGDDDAGLDSALIPLSPERAIWKP